MKTRGYSKQGRCIFGCAVFKGTPAIASAYRKEDAERLVQTQHLVGWYPGSWSNTLVLYLGR